MKFFGALDYVMVIFICLCFDTVFLVLEITLFLFLKHFNWFSN